MEKLRELKEIKQEVSKMDFSYKNVQRVMYLVYETHAILSVKTTAPNKDIALHQINKLIDNELMQLIKSDLGQEIETAFFELIDNFKLVQAYIS